MGISNTGCAFCDHCGSEFRLLSIMNKDMGGLVKAWKRRHERACSKKTPAQRRKWAKKYEGKDRYESSLVVDMNNDGFKDKPAEVGDADIA